LGQRRKKTASAKLMKNFFANIEKNKGARVTENNIYKKEQRFFGVYSSDIL
jgi:hypothetical protein